MTEKSSAQRVRGGNTFAPATVALMVITTLLLLAGTSALLVAAASNSATAYWWIGWGCTAAAIATSYTLWKK